MTRDDKMYQQYLDILKEELRPAMGCTEPIALAYAGAKGRQLLGTLPEKVTARISGAIIKNVKSVIVPNTDGRLASSRRFPWVSSPVMRTGNCRYFPI